MPLLSLPDRPLPSRLADALAEFPVVSHHASGRPWIRGSVRRGIVVEATTAGVCVVLAGDTTANPGALVRLIGSSTRVADLDQVARALDGCFLLMATAADGTRAQGSVSTSRAVFWADVDGVTVVSDEQAPLAQLLGAGLDLDEIVVRLSDAEVNHPFTSGVVWKGVHAAAGHSWLHVENGERPRERRWWSPPDPTESLEALAPRLTDAVRASVATVTAHAAQVSTDLSGGLDSTSLSFFVREQREDLHTVFLRSTNTANNDHVWSDRAAADIGSVHHVLPYDTDLSPATLTDADLFRAQPEGPAQAVRYAKLVQVLLAELPADEPSIHVSGHGGDELFGAVGAMPWSLLRSRHRGRLGDLWGFKQVNKQSILSTLRLVCRTSTPTDDLRTISRSDFSVYSDDYADGSRWVPPVALPVMMSAHARERLQEKVRRSAERTDLVLHDDRSSHQVLEAVTFHGALVRRMNHMVPAGRRTAFASPFLDRPVVEEALRLEIGDRFTGRGVKPLLAAGRPPSMSLDYFMRRDKAEYSAETFAEYGAERDRIRATFADGSVLEDLGLIDAALMRRQIERFSPDGSSLDEVKQIDLTERWLRAAQEHATDRSSQVGARR